MSADNASSVNWPKKLRELRAAVRKEGQELAKRLRADGWTADRWEAEIRADPVMSRDAEPWVALEYLRRRERRNELRSRFGPRLAK